MKTKETRLDEYRQIKGLTYGDLGKIVGITADAMRKAIVRNSVKFHYLNILSSELGISNDWLIRGDGAMDDVLKNKDSGLLLVEQIADKVFEKLLPLFENLEHRQKLIEIILAKSELDKDKEEDKVKSYLPNR